MEGVFPRHTKTQWGIKNEFKIQQSMCLTVEFLNEQRN